MSKAEPSNKLRITMLLGWLWAIVPALLGLIGVVITVVSGKEPSLVYVFSDPIVLPVLGFLTISGTIGTPTLLRVFAAGPRNEAEAAPRRLGLHIAGVVAVVVSCLVLRVVVIRAATPTRLAVDRMRANAAAAQAIGAPVTLGWDVRGWIYADSDVNDEDVPPAIDASVRVHGARGSGVLAIDGRMVAGRWTLDRVVLWPDRGGKIEVVSGVVPPGRGEVDATIVTAIGGSLALGGVIFGLVMLLIRGSDPERAVVRLLVRPGVPFTLRFTPAASRRFRVWLRFELSWQGSEDDYGISTQVEVHGAGGGERRQIRVGNLAPSLGTSARKSTSLHRSVATSSGEGEGLRATVELAEVSAAAGAEVVVTGMVMVAEKCAAGDLLVFVVPR